jgi:hypothetical protein
MSQSLKIDDELLEEIESVDEPVTEEIPEIPKPVKPVASTKKAKGAKPVRTKEFDIRAAHQAWKEKYGIEDEPTYY